MSAKRILTIIVIASTVMLAVGAGPQASGNVYALPAAQAGVTIPYSGRLSLASPGDAAQSAEAGQPAADGAYDFSFALYDVPAGGESLWTETQEGVAVQGGAFTVLLGSVAPLPQAALDGGARWLEVAVRGPGEAEFTRLSPRQELSAAFVAPAGATAPSNGLSCAHTHWGETWSGSQNGLILYGNSDNYATLYAQDKSPHGGYGVYGRSDHGVGVYGRGAAAAFYGDGDVRQGRSDDGLVKAAVYAHCASSPSSSIIFRSFNNVSGSITIANGASEGRCTIDFGFKINDRFFTATGLGEGAVRGVSCYWVFASETKLDCFRWNETGAGTNGHIMVVIY